jgi:sugar phosphate isomerase/epimerase
MSDRLRPTSVTRRDLFATASFGALMLTGTMQAAETTRPTASSEPFGYCLNTSTIRGQKLSVVEEMEVAAKAGYQGIEPWIRELQEYVAQGGSLGDLKKRAADLGLSIESAIGFSDWVNDDDAKRAKGLEQWRRDVELIASIGGKRIASPPNGGYRSAIELPVVAERYREILKIGRSVGVIPELEAWGTSKTMPRLSDLAYTLVETAHPDGCILIDAFQIYRAGCDFGSLRFFNGATIGVFHVNDYPADPPREKLTDADRVYPGDGVCPLVAVFRDLAAIGFRGMLSLELFNREYWKLDALTVARTGLEKTRSLVQRAMASRT